MIFDSNNESAKVIKKNIYTEKFFLKLKLRFWWHSIKHCLAYYNIEGSVVGDGDCEIDRK